MRLPEEGLSELVVHARADLPYKTRSFERLAEVVYRPVRRLAFGVLGDVDAADTVCQEVLLRVLHGLSKLEDAGRFRPWITRITINACRSHIAREQRERDKQAGLAREPLADGARESTGEDRFDELISALSLEERTIVTLKIVEDLEFGAIGEIVGLGLSAVKMRYYRALEKVRSRVD